MDLLIQPKSPVRPVPRVRYRETEYYDGGPLLTYQLRKNKPWMIPNDELGEMNFSAHEALHPTPHKELETFLQTWLYFGLIFEFCFFENDSSGFSAARTPLHKKLEMMYNVFRSDDGRFIISSDIVEGFPSLPKFNWESKEDFQKRCVHLGECLKRTNSVLSCVGPDFDLSLRFSIAALEDYLGGHIARVCTEYGFSPPIYCNISSRGLHTSEICLSMENSGWCPSDIERIKDKNPSVQTWNLLSQIDKSELARDHSRCSKFVCTSYQIDPRNYHVGHCLTDCTCSELLVDNEAVIAALRKPGVVPLLNISLGLSLEELKIDVVESESVPYIAISHVRN
jgi:hypothetical protein